MSGASFNKGVKKKKHENISRYDGEKAELDGFGIIYGNNWI